MMTAYGSMYITENCKGINKLFDKGKTGLVPSQYEEKSR